MAEGTSLFLQGKRYFLRTSKQQPIWVFFLTSVLQALTVLDWYNDVITLWLTSVVYVLTVLDWDNDVILLRLTSY